MGNYIGYFRSLESNDLFSVKFITNSASTGYTEIQLDGNSPFVVNYNESSTPFEPIRTSTATIRVVHNDYLEEIYSPYAQGTQVILTNESTSTQEWVGYLVPKIYNQGYEDCYEVIDIEAADCLSNLQYFDYKPIGSVKAIVSLKDILDVFCDKCGLLEGYFWSRSKKSDESIILPENIMLSEQNFFTSDTDESWKMDQVLEEICRYLGMTALQWKTKLYIIDYESLSANEQLSVAWCPKAGGYSATTVETLDAPFTITEDTYRGNGADISFEPIYNKVTVRDNFYTAEDIVPDILDDAYLVNRINPCNFFTEHEVSAETPYKPSGDKQKFGDDEYIFLQRPFNHEFWESQYLETSSGTPVTLSRQEQASTNCIRNYAGGTIMDLSAAKNPYKNSSDIRYQTIYPSKKDVTRYLCISEKGMTYNSHGTSRIYPIMKMKDGFRSLCPFSENAFLVINYTAMYEEFVNRGYINPDWLKDSGTTTNSGAGSMNFRITIGNKWWQPYANTPPGSHQIVNAWSDISTGSPEYTRDSIFPVLTEWPDGVDTGCTQTDYNALNYVSWQDELGVEGYKIPLSGLSMFDEIKIEIFLPGFIFHNNDSKNQYCWVKDLKFYIAEKGQANENADNNDVVYENIIDTDAVNELSEITVKLTTKTDYSKPAYSNVVLYSGGSATMLETITEDAISGVAQKPEENIIEKYVKQYSTPTKKIQATQVLDGLYPFCKVYGVDVDNPADAYVVLGGTIDFAAERQTITMLQLK